MRARTCVVCAAVAASGGARRHGPVAKLPLMRCAHVIRPLRAPAMRGRHGSRGTTLGTPKSADLSAKTLALWPAVMRSSNAVDCLHSWHPLSRSRLCSGVGSVGGLLWLAVAFRSRAVQCGSFGAAPGEGAHWRASHLFTAGPNHLHTPRLPHARSSPGCGRSRGAAALQSPGARDGESAMASTPQGARATLEGSSPMAPCSGAVPRGRQARPGAAHAWPAGAGDPARGNGA